MPETHEKKVRALGKEEWPPRLPPAGLQDGLPGYAELHCISNFSFQRGASHPQELVRRAYNLGYRALAITDECSVAGVVRAYAGLREHRELALELEAEEPGSRYLREKEDFRLLWGSEFDLGDARLVALAHDLKGWGGLCEFITAARTTGLVPKGQYVVGWERSDFSLLHGCEILLAPRRDAGVPLDLEALCARLASTKALFGNRLWLALELTNQIDDDLWLATLQQAGARTGVPLVAAGDVHMHLRSRKPLQDVLTAVRVGRPVAECGLALQGNAQRYLRQRSRLAGVYPPELLAATLQVAKRCNFGLDEIRYNYPQEVLPKGMTPMQALRRLTLQGAAQRFPEGLSAQLQGFIDKEFLLIEECKYEMFFLTVHDIVREAERRGILCQGRGSAANSVVCYCLGITAADPRVSHPLLERFISKDRKGEPPDIDVDFEHERREEVIQYVYEKYGRDRAAIAAVVISYRTRSAIRDVGKALGLAEPLVDAFAKDHQWFDDELAGGKLFALARETGAELTGHQARLWLELTWELIGFPRHLSQHVGGFVLTETKLTKLVPVEDASMESRSVIQWDKDDIEELGLMKVDVLALGMLTAMRRCFDFVGQRLGRPFTRYDVKSDDRKTYAMIRKADTVGVFQIESRAQMSMLPRLKPAEFYDLVVEVAIVRPGPISGGMVHPYLKARERRAAGLEIVYERSRDEEANNLRPALQDALERTLGVPIFQEQVMEISMIAAGFTATEADGLRRAMAAWKRKGGVHHYEQKLLKGMERKGYRPEFAQRIFEQIKGFGEYGFPESHAYSFALLAYKSSWLKCHEPECFLAAMVNSQPMGFYNPSQLVQDAVRHGVQVLAPDVSHSDWDCTLELGPESTLLSDGEMKKPAVRLGLRLVGSLGKAVGLRIAAVRSEKPFADVQDLSLRAGLDVKDLDALAAADALASLAGHRRQQVWQASALRRAPALLREAPVQEELLELPPAPEGEEIVFDYASLKLTLRRHPLALLRERLARRGLLSKEELHDLPSGRRVAACGLVTVRQQPQTAKGTIFVTLEDETGPVNVIVWKHVREAQRDVLLHSRLLAVHGTWQRDVDSGGEVRHLVAERLEDLTPLLGRLARQPSRSRDFH